jgi:hypothetical protein
MVLPAVGGGVCGLIEGRNSSGSLGIFLCQSLWCFVLGLSCVLTASCIYKMSIEEVGVKYRSETVSPCSYMWILDCDSQCPALALSKIQYSVSIWTLMVQIFEL